MTPKSIAKYAVAFGRQYETLIPGSVGYRGALLAHRNILAELIARFSGDEDQAEVLSELRGLLKQAVKFHVNAGGQAVVVPVLDGLGAILYNGAAEGLMGLGSEEPPSSRFRRRRESRRKRRDSRRLRLRRRVDRASDRAEGRRDRRSQRKRRRADRAEERQDRIVTSLRAGRKRFQQRGKQAVRQQRTQLSLTARAGGFGSRFARGLLRIGDGIKRRRDSRRAEYSSRRAARRSRRAARRSRRATRR